MALSTKKQKLLADLAELDLIEIKGESNVSAANKLSELKNKIAVRMDDATIDVQLQQLRNEWQRNI